MHKDKVIESILWSIALPGFAQLLNKKFLKGILFIGLEILINVQSNFNHIILLSFHGEIRQAIETANYQWLMFYPCLYFFAMWDAYKDSIEQRLPYSYLPFVFSAYFVTVGLILSPSIILFGKLWGPVWLPMLFVIPGVLIGLIIRKGISYFT
ncbi:hypothetical protein J2S09_002733 [Bacillus fengqiuensis]|nr:hypothetical protein [Bacillus fengqiuensis]